MMSTVDGYRTQGRKQVLERGGVNLLGLHACGRGGGSSFGPNVKKPTSKSRDASRPRQNFLKYFGGPKSHI